MQASHKLAEEVYKKAQGQQAAGAGQKAEEAEEPAKKPGDDNVVDAEFKVKDKE